MGRPRSFDYDEARRLHALGLSYVEIGNRLGVSDTSVARACDAGYRRRQYANARANIEALKHPCFGGCGRLVWGHTEGSGYCLACLGERRNVERHGTETEYVQGCRCKACTDASTAARRLRRQSNLERERLYAREYKRRRRDEGRQAA